MLLKDKKRKQENPNHRFHLHRSSSFTSHCCLLPYRMKVITQIFCGTCPVAVRSLLSIFLLLLLLWLQCRWNFVCFSLVDHIPVSSQCSDSIGVGATTQHLEPCVHVDWVHVEGELEEVNQNQ